MEGGLAGFLLASAIAGGRPGGGAPPMNRFIELLKNFNYIKKESCLKVIHIDSNLTYNLN